MARKKKGPGKARKKASGKKASAGARGSKSKKTGKKKAEKKKAATKKAATVRRPVTKGAKKRPATRKATKKKAPAKKSPRKTTRKATAGKRPARKKVSRKGARDAAFFDHFRRKLLDGRAQITRRLDELREELRGLDETPRELEEWAQEEKDRDILIRLEDRETEELRKIQAALGLIDRKEYGLCQACGKPIPRARLEELPTAFRCVNCTP